MKKIGIIFAMNEELVAFRNTVKIDKEYSIFELKFYECIISKIRCVFVECGVGKVNAARTTQILIDNLKVDFIFNIGVAGGIDDKLKIGNIVIGEKLVQHDFDITAFNHVKGNIPNVGVFINSDDYLVKVANDVLRKDKQKNVFSGVIASGDIFCTDKNMANKINNKFDALCVEMEGASVAQVCYLNHIPFLIMRSISDTPNNNNVISYDEFLVESSKIMSNAMKKIVIKLSCDNI